MMNDLKRILLKLSGEALAGDKDFGFDEATCLKVAKQVKQVTDCDCHRRRQFLARTQQQQDH